MAKTLCKTNIRKALRKSWDTNGFEDVNDDWQACIQRNYSFLGVPPMCPFEVVLWNWRTEYEIRFSVGGCTSMTEYVDYATERILARLDERAA